MAFGFHWCTPWTRHGYRGWTLSNKIQLVAIFLVLISPCWSNSLDVLWLLRAFSTTLPCSSKLKSSRRTHWIVNCHPNHLDLLSPILSWCKLQRGFSSNPPPLPPSSNRRPSDTETTQRSSFTQHEESGSGISCFKCYIFWKNPMGGGLWAPLRHSTPPSIFWFDLLVF